VAILHPATLTPTKMDMLGAWVPRQPWRGDADTSTLATLGAYRFDDPAGKVGIETHVLLTADGQIFQVPVTYRDAPVAGAESRLVATMHHSVLGERWVYDACGDPVYVQALATAILTGGTQAELLVVTDTGHKRRQPTMLVSGSGLPGSAIPPVEAISSWNDGTKTVMRAGGLELTLFRTIEPQRESSELGDSQTLVGTWPGQDSPTLLALAETAQRR